MSETTFLSECLTLFPEISCAAMGKRQNLGELERKLKHVKVRDCLETKDLEIIRDSEDWEYRLFWPDLRFEVSRKGSIEGCFGFSSEKLIKTLYKEFKNIEVVSVILRFVDPDNYAILSPPVEKLLGLLPESDHIRYYLTFLSELHCIHEQFRELKKIAEVDMALWSLSHILNNRGKEEFWEKLSIDVRDRIERIYSNYNKSIFFLKRKLRKALFQAYDCFKGKDLAMYRYRLLIAECLNDNGIDPDLAMVATSYTLESFVWDYFHNPELKKKLPQKAEIKLHKLIEILLGTGGIHNAEADFNFCRHRRDESIHPWLGPVEKENRSRFINRMESIIQRKSTGNL